MAERTLNWKGDEVLRAFRKAQRKGVDATMAAAILNAKGKHGPGAHGANRFESHSGELERSIRVVNKAKSDRRGAVGTWGSMNNAYALRIELGFQGKDSLGRVINQQAYPYLRPAADAEYPRLEGRIERSYRGPRAT